VACVDGPFSSIRPCDTRQGLGVAENAGLADALPARHQITRASERSMTFNAFVNDQSAGRIFARLQCRRRMHCVSTYLHRASQAGATLSDLLFSPAYATICAFRGRHLGYLYKFASAATRSSQNTHNMALKLGVVDLDAVEKQCPDIFPSEMGCISGPG